MFDLRLNSGFVLFTDFICSVILLNFSISGQTSQLSLHDLNIGFVSLSLLKSTAMFKGMYKNF